MKRSDIKGFTLNFLSFYLEFVFVNFLLRVLAFGKNYKTIYRFEI